MEMLAEGRCETSSSSSPRSVLANSLAAVSPAATPSALSLPLRTPPLRVRLVNGNSGLRLRSAFVGVVEVAEGGKMVDREEERVTRKVQSGEDRCESLN